MDPYFETARVRVRGTEVTTLTDDTGKFRLAGVFSGLAVREVLHSRHDPLQGTVSMPVGAEMPTPWTLSRAGGEASGRAAGTAEG